MSTEITDTSRRLAPRLIEDWFLANGRDLPWRTALPHSSGCTPWGIMISEFMLQQTPVIRVLPAWEAWMNRWPTPADLAAEPASEAVRAWGRLGYPRRAQRLHAAAVAIVEKHDGAVPDTREALQELPGVGAYTSAAIAAFAFGRRESVVDTNIRRVHARLFSGKALPAPSFTAAEARLAEELLPEDRAESVTWNAAVMELGALVCTARSPKCEECPVAAQCAWLAAGSPEPEYTPRGQAWHGTDRQVRGAILAVLREAGTPVPRELFLERPDGWDGPAGTGSPDLSWGGSGVLHHLDALHRLKAPAEQRERCLAGLLKDGLASESDAGLTL
ncbi:MULTISPECIES: A/G-specific adenine glycosylase [Arthrobacter]|uniref:A/G-specific adenine glycosylase n=2 Tax=Arthrobacter TaxID=1663 RepID=A0ABU9KIM3_9MICC|nr:A/G-specific adenine glycosylase [Arthrobacter sp. YJM1]MDP5227011.1 A/G-specific adenine glycosylase [Arthrobacter sp. YJM1]